MIIKCMLLSTGLAGLGYGVYQSGSTVAVIVVSMVVLIFGLTAETDKKGE
jgi:hypothetical protein